MKLPTVPGSQTLGVAPPPPTFAGLSTVHLRTSDLNKSVRFYGELVGLPLLRTEPQPLRRYVFGLGAAGLLILEEVKEPAGSGGAVGQVGIGLPDVEALEALRKRILSLGTPVSGLEDHGYLYCFRFRDPACGVVLQATAPGRTFDASDLSGDPEPVPAARDLLRGRPSG
jgi:catechol 2,3-dioxygenase-like lactoylglutathione lyase family enzyme